MKNLCTLSDYLYLNKGLTLYDSLMAHSDHGEGFCLHYLCIDDRSYDKLVGLHLPNLQPYPAQRISELCDTAKEYVHQETGNYTRYQHYCWSLGSRFSLWLVQKLHVPSIMYLDADICFYFDIDLVYKEIGCKQIGITPHLHNSKQDAVGAYNVCMVFFGAGGFQCLSWWVHVVCDPNNPHYRTHGMCGDQKYLDLFEEKYDSVHVVGSTIMQGAPWNFRLFDWQGFDMKDHRYVIYRGKEYPLCWIHFSHFYPHFNINFYDSGEKNYGNFLSVAEPIKDLYNEYLRLNIEAHGRYFG